ncbi:MAG: hypothetical protein S4CHLAM7_13650 [Chlamydiae bacterium]|nr:hypothetical protein [Chlamydiota bacterium]
MTANYKGWICLDIDGTLTNEILSIPKPVLEYIHFLHQEQWQLIFVTGRLFSLGYKVLKSLTFPYYFVPQNGASWFEMPSQKIGSRHYLALKTIQELEPLIKGSGLDFVLITGIENQDQCFYRPDRLKIETLEHIQKNLSSLAGQWKAVSSFTDLGLENFPMAKIYGSNECLKNVISSLQKVSSIEAYLLEDSAKPNHSVIHIMRKGVNKGKAVLDIINTPLLTKTIISAGNDFNDESLLDIADIKIAMSDSPKFLLEKADIIAPSVKNYGIIPALKKAIEQTKLL